MKLKKLVVAALSAAMVVTSLPTVSQAASQADSPKAVAGSFTDLNQEAMTEAMGAGWNLGNSFEANKGGIPSETAWGNPIVTEDLFKAVKAAGFKTVRIPVSYLDYITEAKDADGKTVYTIDAKWMARIKEVVDMCTAQGLYTIINMHGDGYTTIEHGWQFCGLGTLDADGNSYDTFTTYDDQGKPAGTFNRVFIQEGTIDSYTYKETEYTDSGEKYVDGSHIFESADGKKLYVFYFDEIQEKYEQCWNQIASLFKDYDEHLIFESMNEEFNGSYPTKLPEQQYENINTMNQIFLDTVRQSGGNNDKRWVLIPGWNTNIDQTVNGMFRIPEDTHLSAEVPDGEKRIMVSVHYYDPWTFAGTDSKAVTTWGTDAEKAAMKSQFQKVYEAFVEEGYPVVIGEYGAIDKEDDNAENVTAREVYYKTVCEYSKELGLVPVAWDMGIDEKYQFCLIDRTNYGFTWKNLVDQIMSVYVDESEVPTDIKLSDTSVSLKTGETKQLSFTLEPATATLAADWSSSDETVAQVNLFGKVTAMGPGTCTVTGTLSNGKQVQCKVTVIQEYLALKLFALETSSWKTLESDTIAEIKPGGGTYTVKLTVPSTYFNKIGSLYLKDYLVYQNSTAESVTSYIDLDIQSVKLNGTAIPFKAGKNVWQYDERKAENKVIDVCLATAWNNEQTGLNDSLLDKLTVRTDYTIDFAGIPQAATNTFEVTFKASNVYIKGVTTATNPDNDPAKNQTPTPQPQSTLSLAKSSASIGVGESATFSVKTNGTITAASNKTKVATVAVKAAKKTYTVKGKKAGTAKITVKAGTVSKIMTVKVKAKPTKITPKKKTVNVKAGKKVSVKLKYKPATATSYQFTNTNAKTLKKKKITVTASGSKVTVQTNKKTKKGTYTVKLKSYNKKSVSFKVKVK